MFNSLAQGASLELAYMAPIEFGIARETFKSGSQFVRSTQTVRSTSQIGLHDNMRQSHLVKCVGMSNNKSLLPLPRLSLDIGVLHRPGIGIGFFLLGITCQTIMEANAKWLAQDYPVGQVAFFRSLLAFLPIAILVSFSGGLSALKTARLAM